MVDVLAMNGGSTRLWWSTEGYGAEACAADMRRGQEQL